MAVGFARKYDSKEREREKKRRVLSAVMDMGECYVSRYTGASHELISPF